MDEFSTLLCTCLAPGCAKKYNPLDSDSYTPNVYCSEDCERAALHGESILDSLYREMGKIRQPRPKFIRTANPSLPKVA